MLIGEYERKEIDEWIKVQLVNLNADANGIVTFTYGSEDYMVSGKAAKRIAEEIMPQLNILFPNVVFLFLPWYITVSDLKEMEQLK